MRKQYLRSSFWHSFQWIRCKNHWQVKLKGIWIPINVRIMHLCRVLFHTQLSVSVRIFGMNFGAKIAQWLWFAPYGMPFVATECIVSEWPTECEKYFNQKHTYHFDRISSFHRHLPASTLPEALWKITESSLKHLFIYDFINFNQIKPLPFKDGLFDAHTHIANIF